MYVSDILQFAKYFQLHYFICNERLLYRSGLECGVGSQQLSTFEVSAIYYLWDLVYILCLCFSMTSSVKWDGNYVHLTALFTGLKVVAICPGTSTEKVMHVCWQFLLLFDHPSKHRSKNLYVNQGQGSDQVVFYFFIFLF